MNLVKMIQDQLSGDVLNKLSSVIGAEPEATSRAASAAVPTLLSGLVNQFSSIDGAKKLSNVLSGLDTSAIGNFANMLGGDSSSLLGKGSGLLASLFGDGLINSAANAIGRFSGLSPNLAKPLLAYLAPFGSLRFMDWMEGNQYGLCSGGDRDGEDCYDEIKGKGCPAGRCVMAGA